MTVEKDKTWILKSLQRMEKIFVKDFEAVECLGVLRDKAKSLVVGEDTQEEPRAFFPLPSEVKDQINSYALFSDGACRGNPGPGSWSAMGQSWDGQVLFELSGINLSTTNNRMELEGAMASLKELFLYLKGLGQNPREHSIRVYLYSDSKYVVEGVKMWMPQWKGRGWKKSDNKIPENLEYWQEFDQVLQGFSQVTMNWIKGHAGHPQNERCDRLANWALDDAGY